MESTAVIRPKGEDFNFEVPVRHIAWYTDAGYEPLSTIVFRNAAHYSDIVVDIGAHGGWYSSVAARANPTARVVAVEASPDNHQLLQRNVEGLSNVETINAAFSSAAGEVDLHLTEASDNCGIYGHRNSPTLSLARVPMIESSRLGMASNQSTLVKIDVEGAEMDVLSGLEPALQEAGAVRMLVEFNPSCLARGGHSDPTVLSDWLFDHGFSIFVIDDHRFRWRRLSPMDLPDQIMAGSPYVNFFCVRGVESVGVAAVLHSTNLGGAERSFAETAAALVRRGHFVHAIVPDEPRDGPIEQHLAAAGVTVSRSAVEWWASTDPNHDWLAAGRGLDEVEAEFVLLNPQVVVTWTSVVPVGALAAQRLGIPHVWSVNEFIDWDHELITPLAVAELGREMAEMSDALAANSDAVASHVFGPHEDVLVRADAREGSREQEPRPQLLEEREGGPPSGDPIIGIFGTVKQRKGHEDLVRALAILRDSGQVARLRVVGPGDPEVIADLMRVAEECGVGDFVDFVGQVSDVGPEMARVDVVAVPSWAEAFGRVPFEAARRGVPVVYSNVGGPAVYMTDGVTGVACDPRDPVSLAGAIARILTDNDLRVALSASAWKVLSRWLAEHSGVDELEAILVKLAPRCRGGSSAMRHRLELEAARIRQRDVATHRRLVETLEQVDVDPTEWGRITAQNHRDLEAARRRDEEQQGAIEVLQDTVEVLQEQLNNVARSRSWRLTRTLRRLRRLGPSR